jgi:hypothetical protein
VTEPSTFQKVTVSQKPLYGPRKLLLCGFGAEAQKRLAGVLEMAGLADVPRVWAAADQAVATLASLLALPDGSGMGAGSPLPRAIIVAGITEAQLIGLMNMCKKSGMQPSLWACLTPVSETWPLEQLLAELARERDAMATRKR